MPESTIENGLGSVGNTGNNSKDEALHGSRPKNNTGSMGIVEVVEPTVPWELPPEELQTHAIKQRPYFKTYSSWFSLDDKRLPPGLYYHTAGKDGASNSDIRVCSPIYAEAQTCSDDSGSWGLLLKFIDPKMRWHYWAMPKRLLKGNGEELRGILLDMGVCISADGNQLLLKWLVEAKPEGQITAATCTGWHQQHDKLAFVFPHRVIGSDKVYFQSEQTCHHEFKSAGSLEGWQQSIAKLCVDNPMLQFVVASAFAGPLLKHIRQYDGSVGIHLMGDSSQGKTTALHVAASVWGAPSFVKTWRATSNGLEGIAAMQNDTMLALDEISECDPQEIGSIVYALGNGIGKQRANRYGGVREATRWRLTLLSSGERTLSAHMREANQQVKAGQQVRLLDIPATQRKYGIFDCLHGTASGSSFAAKLNQGLQAHYGHAGMRFIECLIDDKQDLSTFYTDITSLPMFASTDSLMGRAARVFALMGMAGELAVSYGIVPWASGDSLRAAGTAYQLWRDFRGTAPTEDKQILDAVRDFIERYGDARFMPLKSDLGSGLPPRDRAGFWKDSVTGRHYCFYPTALERAVPGFERNRILLALDQAGWIADRDTDRRTKKLILSDSSKVGLYVIQPQESSELLSAFP